MFRIINPKDLKFWPRSDEEMIDLTIKGECISLNIGIVAHYPLL